MTYLPDLIQRYPPSEPCSCAICRSYCFRPGWWTVKEAALAMQAGYTHRMMLEISPERTFGILSPAFSGNEAFIATRVHSAKGCTFLIAGRCELHDSGLQPLECRFCHHDRPGQGLLCHQDIEKDWHSPAGHRLVQRWCRQTGVWDYLNLFGLGHFQRKFKAV